eukprot:5850633-Pyramimonas_sp.AAC.1
MSNAGLGFWGTALCVIGRSFLELVRSDFMSTAVLYARKSFPRLQLSQNPADSQQQSQSRVRMQ